MNNMLLGVIDATTYHDGLKELSLHRSLAAIPFAGRYRLIDFILSNMVNSGIVSVAIFPKYQYRSLMDHLGSGKNWDLNRKRDGLFFFPSPNLDSPNKGIGSFSHFAANMDYFYRSRQEYALISNCFTVFNMDFKPVLDRHINTGCDITVICKEEQSLEMFLVKKSLLIELINTRDETGYTCMCDVVADQDHNNYTLCTYEYTGSYVAIDSIETYFQANMKLLQAQTWKDLFLKDQPIYTKVKDEPPTRYLTGSSVRNSIIANGCRIEGTVENSIISRGVVIGKGTVVKNSIIMQKCEIEENCVLESAILDKDVKVQPNTSLIGTEENPFVVRKGTVQGALMNS
ncbi:glucose-1-phosphate adenylyltransferase [Bacillus mesophilum]|uniref:Glucose-1-phosphate adenylyltransferase n=2 Tax=Bacillus mesophilum TaxID=1071718 RepID=A0A7V7RHK0_9BACI|nr:sugar phosphate nucleotidyltransferase [Bacillus mesophilum]KAB2329015.1 glucose-1-phosphate adenylyltransferase [Bacillus mesophilum]